jgi:hypothetical protein
MPAIWLMGGTTDTFRSPQVAIGSDWAIRDLSEIAFC